MLQTRRRSQRGRRRRRGQRCWPTRWVRAHVAAAPRGRAQHPCRGATPPCASRSRHAGLCVADRAPRAHRAAAAAAADDKTLRVMLAGGVAGCISKTITAPLARLTILYQVRRAATCRCTPRSAAAPPRSRRHVCCVLAAQMLTRSHPRAALAPPRAGAEHGYGAWLVRRALAQRARSSGARRSRGGFVGAHPAPRCAPAAPQAARLTRPTSPTPAQALWKGNGVTIVHRLPYSAINFFVYERLMVALSAGRPGRHRDDSSAAAVVRL